MSNSTSSERLAEHVFNGSLAIQVVLIAVVGIVATDYDKVVSIPDFEPRFRWFLWALVGLSLIACLLSILTVNCMRASNKPGMLILSLLYVLIVGIACASAGIVWVTVL